MPSAGLRENPQKAGEVASKLLDEGNSACKIDPFPPNHPIRDIPLREIENGYIIPPTGPGLGIKFDENVLKKHLVE